ncbi:MAG: ABC transporter permease [Acidobacteriaceae bacterium]|nr:ABC transporter permease [Acidobacteriaceae bacterium]
MMRQISSGLVSDLRFAWRQIRRRPGFAASAIFVLGLGIGSSTAVFSILYEALLKPLPYPGADRIVFLHNAFPKSQLALSGVSSVDYAELKRHNEIFSATGVYYFNDLTMTGAGDARHVDPVNASASLFRVLRVKPALGRAISEEDDRYGAPKVAVLSDAFWRSAFDANPKVLGSMIHLNGEPYTIIGVMPPDFHFPYPATQLWLPLALKPAEWSEMGRADKWLQMIARLAKGVGPEHAQAALMAVSHHLAQQYPAFYPENVGWHFTMQPLLEEQTKPIRVWLLLAFSAVLCVLLIACANVSGLLLIRSSARSGEFAIRAALGAARYRIIRQILGETALLVGAGCVLGLIFASWAVPLSNRYGPFLRNARVETETIIFVIAMAFLSTLVAGLVPAFVSARMPIEQALKSGSTRTATRGSRWRYALVAGQIAVAITLIFTATLLSRSFLKLMQVSPGFSPDRVWSAAIALPQTQYKNEEADLRFFHRLQERIAALPGVERVSACTAPPFNASGVLTLNVSFPGRADRVNQPKAQVVAALPGYFETMKIPLQRGRAFTQQDLSLRVVVIDEEFARIYFPREDPIGKQIGIGGEQDRPSRVIGIVANVENSGLGGPHKPEIYAPDPEEMSSSMYLVVRTKNDLDITSAVRNQLAALDPNVALFDVATMNERIAQSVKLRRFIAWLLNGFGAVGLLLAALGLYGSLAHLVELRRREIGIRMALGAVWQHVIRTVVAQGALVVTAGVLMGIAGAIFAGTLVRNQLFGVSTYDTVAWFAVSGILAVAAVLAAWFPAWRAVRIQPMETLREE